MENEDFNIPDIPNWGIDANTKNDPVYPIKKRTNEEHAGYTWDRPALQKNTVEVLHSNERPNLTAVYGTSVPPSGLSGAIRRWAFKYGEGSFLHWLPLLIADRINVLEGIAEDLKRGYFPNIFAERGIRAEWKFNKPVVIRKAAVAILITSGIVLLIRHQLKKKKQLQIEG